MATTDGRPGSNESSIRIALQHVRVATVDGGEAGVLVIKEDQLVAVLTRVDEALYSAKGQWFLETGYGRLSGCHALFQTLEEAQTWISQPLFIRGYGLRLGRSFTLSACSFRPRLGGLNVLLLPGNDLPYKPVGAKPAHRPGTRSNGNAAAEPRPRRDCYCY